jgi:hypothetical protein
MMRNGMNMMIFGRFLYLKKELKQYHHILDPEHQESKIKKGNLVVIDKFLINEREKLKIKFLRPLDPIIRFLGL